LCDKAGRTEEFIRNFFRGASGIFNFAIHYSLNGHIEVDGDTARASWYLFMPCTLAAGNQAMWRAGIDHETLLDLTGGPGVQNRVRIVTLSAGPNRI
jgi:hypothetical protein